MKATRFKWLLHFLFILPFTLTAQQRGYVDDSDSDQAFQLAKEYKDVTALSLKSEQKVVFKYQDDKGLFVTEKLREEFLGLGPGNFYKTEFYNDQAQVTDATISYKNGKTVPSSLISPKYENYKQSGIFHSDAKVCYIKMPQYKGYRYDVSITKQIDDVKYLTTIYFHESYPILEKKVKFVVPNWMDVELKEMNFEGYEIEKTVSFDDELNANIHTYTLTELAEMKKERKSQGPSYIYPHILVLSKGYEQNGKAVQLFKSVDQLYAWYKSLVDDMDNDPKALKPTVDEVTKDAASDLDKVKNIYYWVQDNVRYIAFEDGLAGFKPDVCQNVYNNRYGDCKGMANLTKEMLKSAGFDARLVWLGTRRLAYDYTTPSLAVDNHMICAVFLDGDIYYLDPTEKYNAFGEYAERIQGRPVLIENGDKPLLKNIPKTTLADNATIVKMAVALNGENLEGKITHILHGESKSSLLYGLSSIENDHKEDALKRYFNSGDNNYKIDSLTMPDLVNRDGAINIDYDVTLKNMTSSFDNDIYIELDVFKEFDRYKMESDRKNDYQFSYKFLIDTEIELAIPEGYEVSYIPEAIAEDNDYYQFDVKYEQQGDKLVYTKKLSIKEALLPKEEFKNWNQVIKKLKEFYTEQITLSKK